MALQISVTAPCSRLWISVLLDKSASVHMVSISLSHLLFLSLSDME